MAYKKNQINLRMSEKNSTFAGLFCAMCACTRENLEKIGKKDAAKRNTNIDLDAVVGCANDSAG